MSYSIEPRNDEWNSDCPQDERKYDGPAGIDSVIDSNWNEVYENFDDMNLKEELLRGIYAYGFEKPSAIQQRAIVPCIKVVFSDEVGELVKILISGHGCYRPGPVWYR